MLHVLVFALILFILYQALWSRWLPVYAQIRKEIEAGNIGEPRLVQANFCVQISHVDRVKDISLGGGGILDIGIYIVQFATMIFKEMPDSITAVGTLKGGKTFALKGQENALVSLR